MAKPNLSAGQGGAVSPPDPWDPLIRITHWGVAAAVVVNGLINEGGSVPHVWIGWGVMALLFIRLIWGLVGPHEARFSAFPPNPRAAIGHLGDLARGRPQEHRSHNPAGAMMVYALWACLAVVISTGLIMTGGKSPVTIAEEKAAVAAGDWSVLVKPDEGGDGEAGTESESLTKEVHDVAANLMLILALVHVAGVAVESRALRRNLVRPMVLARRGNGAGPRA